MGGLVAAGVVWHDSILEEMEPPSKPRREETIDGGKTWTDVTATGLPINVTAFDLTGPTSATAIVVDSGCAGFKTDCWYRNYLVATTDGGRTWTHL